LTVKNIQLLAKPGHEHLYITELIPKYMVDKKIVKNAAAVLKATLGRTIIDMQCVTNKSPHVLLLINISSTDGQSLVY
jgi:hypothetical protein